MEGTISEVSGGPRGLRQRLSVAALEPVCFSVAALADRHARAGVAELGGVARPGGQGARLRAHLGDNILYTTTTIQNVCFM